STLRTLKEAVDVCVQIFQGGSPLEPDQARPLDAYLHAISPHPREPPLEIKPALEATLDYDRPKYHGGDETRGRALFYRACHSCHPRGGKGLAPPIAGLPVPDQARKAREGN